MVRLTSVALMLAALSACAPAVQVAAPPPPPPDTTTAAAPLRLRHAVRPVPLTQAFRRAVERGTRTLDGRPGPAYWQQRVEYRIEAELDPAAARLQAQQIAVYHNNSPDTLHSVLVHLHQNAFAEGVQRVRRVPITGGVTLEHVVVNGIPARTGTGTGSRYRVDGTLLWIDLARPLLPGSALELGIGWHFTVPPRGAPRTGHADNEAFVVAQWYPQIAVYDDLRGWHDTPYWTNGEFYTEYGDFEVQLTVPEGWIVGATGTLDNADEVLAPEVRARLARAAAQDSIVHVVTADDIEQRRVTAVEPGAQLTWRFRARDVRDFAFAASNRYLWDATRVGWPGARAPVTVHALYRPEAARWTEAARYMRHATAFHAQRWGAYIYPHITAAEGPIGGMEYPMLVFIGAPAQAADLYAVLSHEIAHQWWPMMVGSNESHYAWQDEGLATYVEDLSARDYFDGSTPHFATQDAYLRIAGSDAELPIMTRPDLFGIGAQYGVAAYTKPGTLLRALGAVIGEDVVHDALREYTTRWLLRHPAPFDFFHVVEDVAQQDLDWFWTPWFFDTAVLDHAVRAVSIAAGRVTITVEDLGDAPMPVPVRITLASGAVLNERLPVEPWLRGEMTQTLTLTVAEPVTLIEIDPDRLLPDVRRENNRWTPSQN
jgi:hypothetical protein